VFGVDVADQDEPTFQAVFFDCDNDADADLYLSTDKGAATDNKNRLFENVGNALVDISVASGAAISLDSMGVAVGDFDGNGYQDLFCTNGPAGHRLLMNEPSDVDDTFLFERSAEAGVEVNSLGWGAAFFDYDNDGHLELYVCDQVGANQLFDCDGTWPCTDIAASVDVDDAGDSYGIALADVDNDGDVDLIVQDNDEPLKLYINHEGELRNWLKVRVFGLGHNGPAIGALVRVRVGATWQMREVLAGGNNYKGQNELTVHFGLSDATVVDEVEITWPGGFTRSFLGVPVNQTLSGVPPADIPTVSELGLAVLALGLLAAGSAIAQRSRRRIGRPTPR
jgi:hypothetical protein